VLITDTDGRILVQRVDYRTVRLLPGGAVDARESPSRAAARELAEELGVSMSPVHGLAVDWVPSTAPGIDPEMGFPGEVLYVYDGGTWSAEQIAQIRLPENEILAVDFVEPADLPDLMAPGDARRALAALRARINGSGTALLEDGRPIAPTVLDRLEVLRTRRKPQRWPWRGEPVTPVLRMKQSWGWLFAPDGRVLVLIGADTGSACLPGGTLEPADQGDPAAALRREAYEEAQVRTSEPLYLGYLYDDTDRACTDAGPCARVRMAAAITHYGPATLDPATRQTYARVLATPEQVVELFDWGPESHRQLDSVHKARQHLGLPRPARQPIIELPTHGGVL
jgi:8-oxo-dGTP pyrophosphatase MutT (NUDIX family)